MDISLQAALADTRIPLVEVTPGDDPQGEPELELDDDPSRASRVDVSRAPLLVTVAQVGA